MRYGSCFAGSNEIWLPPYKPNTPVYPPCPRPVPYVVTVYFDDSLKRWRQESTEEIPEIWTVQSLVLLGTTTLWGAAKRCDLQAWSRFTALYYFMSCGGGKRALFLGQINGTWIFVVVMEWCAFSIGNIVARIWVWDQLSVCVSRAMWLCAFVRQRNDEIIYSRSGTVIEFI